MNLHFQTAAWSQNQIQEKPTCTCVCAQVCPYTHEVTKAYTQLHMQQLIGSKNRVLSSKMERREVFLTKDKVPWASKKPAIDFKSISCYAYDPPNLRKLRPEGEEGCRRTQMLPLEPQLDQPQRASIATCSSSASLHHTASCSPHHCQKDLSALWDSLRENICAHASIWREQSSFLPPCPLLFFFLWSKLVFITETTSVII